MNEYFLKPLAFVMLVFTSMPVFSVPYPCDNSQATQVYLDVNVSNDAGSIQGYVNYYNTKTALEKYQKSRYQIEEEFVNLSTPATLNTPARPAYKVSKPKPAAWTGLAATQAGFFYYNVTLDFKHQSQTYSGVIYQCQLCSSGIADNLIAVSNAIVRYTGCRIPISLPGGPILSPG
jgi:hypothetical protein